MNKVLQVVWQFLGVQSQTNELVERFNGMLKCMLRKFVEHSGKDLPQWIPFLLFALRCPKPRQVSPPDGEGPLILPGSYPS